MVDVGDIAPSFIPDTRRKPWKLKNSAGLQCLLKPPSPASATMTLALPKKGLLEQKARSVVGSSYLAHIGVPNVLYKELGIEVEPMSSHDTIIKLHDLQGEMHS